jgi:endonuclease III
MVSIDYMSKPGVKQALAKILQERLHQDPDPKLKATIGALPLSESEVYQPLKVREVIGEKRQYLIGAIGKETGIGSTETALELSKIYKTAEQVLEMPDSAVEREINPVGYLRKTVYG